MASRPLVSFKAAPADAVPTIRPSENSRLEQAERISTGSYANWSSPASQVCNDNGHELAAIGSSAKAMLRSYWVHIPPQIREGLLKQTEVTLAEDQWEEETLNVSLDSYRTMLRAVVEISPRCRPHLGVSDRGNFLAAWSNANARVVIEFAPMDRMIWIVTSKANGENNRATGRTNVGEIRGILNIHHGRQVVDGEE